MNSPRGESRPGVIKTPKFANPTIVLRYVRNDNKLHFHISLVTQKRGDYTFLLDLVKTTEIQISKLRHFRGTVSLSTCGRRFFIKSSFLQRNRRISRIFGWVPLSELEKPRRRRRQKKTTK